MAVLRVFVFDISISTYGFKRIVKRRATKRLVKDLLPE